MYVELPQSTAETPPLNTVDGVDDVLIEQIWYDLNEQIPRARVNRVVNEIALGFQNASVRTFLHIFIHRRALDRLRLELNENTSRENCSLDEQP